MWDLVQTLLCEINIFADHFGGCGLKLNDDFASVSLMGRFAEIDECYKLSNSSKSLIQYEHNLEYDPI